jgi:hypothetical protein
MPSEVRFWEGYKGEMLIYRYTLSSWIPASWTSWFGQDFVHPSIGWIAQLQHLSAQPRRKGIDGRQVESPAWSST